VTVLHHFGDPEVAWKETATGLTPFRGEERLTWHPLPGSQSTFMVCPVTEVLYEGNRGPGKTDTLLMDFAQDVGQGWGADWTGVLFRKTYPDLQDVIAKSLKWFSLMYPGAEFNSGNSTWHWPTGEMLKFRQFAKPADYWKYHGHAYPWIAWEELCTYPDDQCFKSMFSCLRSSRPNMPRKVRATTNPYGVGHNWVKSRYELPVPPGHTISRIITREPSGEECVPRVAVHGHLDENKILLHAEPKYKQTIRTAARNPAELEAWLNGSWDIVAGGMIDDIWARLRDRIVVEPFAVPPNWRIDRSLDWGSSKPCSVGFWAESDGSDYVDAKGFWRSTVKGDVFRVGEIYTWNGRPNEGSRLLATELSRRIVEYQVSRGWQTEKWSLVRPGPADSSIFDEENGNCIAEDLEKRVRLDDGKEYRGATFEHADKKPGSRKQGWQQLRKYLSAVESKAGVGRETPGLFVWSTCSHWLRTVPSLPRDEKDMDDVDTEAEDHAGDETRYRLRLERISQGSGRISGGSY
jgi:hypothetical protein